MTEVSLAQRPTRTDAEYEALCSQLLHDMQDLNAQIENDRKESERIKAETQVLRDEGLRLQAKIWAALDQLQATGR